MEADLMSMHDMQYQYVTGQMRPTFAALVAEYEERSANTVRSQECLLDIRYGSAGRETFDFFTAGGEPKGTLVYFHAGYWQSRDKSTFRFIAPSFTSRGFNVALVNYPLCPTVSLASLVQSARASIPKILAHIRAIGQPENPLIVSGHSAGGHIAVELALTQWPQLGRHGRPIDGVIALSGIFDLAPLVATTLNDNLRLDLGSAAEHSPLYRILEDLPPALFVAGGEETPAFIVQSTRIHEAWLKAGNRSTLDVTPGADHFSLLQSFTSFDGELASKVNHLLKGART
jgi:arylformamidase